MEKQYKWKIGGFYDKADANKVGHEIEELEEKTPTNVLERAKDKNSELNKLFEWDDTIAGEKYRKQQATQILNNIVVHIRKDVNDTTKVVKAFVNVKKGEEYENREVILKSPTQYNMLLDKAIKELKSVAEKYCDIEELQEVFNAIAKL